MKLWWLLYALHPRDLRQDAFEQSGRVQQLECAPRVPFGQHFEQFIAYALAAYLLDLGCQSLDRREGFVLDLVAEARGEAHRTQHAQFVFIEAAHRIANRAND